MICNLVLVCPTNDGICALAGTETNLTVPRRQWAASEKDSIRAQVFGTFRQFFEIFLPFMKILNWEDCVTPSDENVFVCLSKMETTSLHSGEHNVQNIFQC